MENSQESLTKIVNGFKDQTFEVFCLMLELRTQNEIGQALGLNIKQVKYHIGLIYKAFGINTCRAETQSKRLLFTRTFVETKPKYGLESFLDQPA